MDNIKQIVQEIGLVEINEVVSRYNNDDNLMDALAGYVPIPVSECIFSAEAIASALNNFNKEKLMILTPEIAVIEALAKQDTCIKSIYVCVPSDMDEESIDRITKNVPDGIEVSFFREGEFIRSFNSLNGAIVSFGYCDDSNAIILRSNYKMMDQYKSFHGRKILVSCAEGLSNERPIGWIAINKNDFFTDLIRKG